MVLEPHSRLLFIGDSITDCGRRRPIGEGAFGEALGNGYVSLVNATLTAAYPGHHIHCMNLGVNGHTVFDLKARWRRDVLDHHPDWLSIMIGINDVWLQLDHPSPTRFESSLQAYAQTLDDLIRQAKPGLKGLILMTPYCIEPQRRDPMRALMDRYGAAVRELAAQHRALLVDTQAAFDHVLQWLSPAELAPDRVHPNMVGHMVIARAFLHRIGVVDGRPLSHDGEEPK